MHAAPNEIALRWPGFRDMPAALGLIGVRVDTDEAAARLQLHGKTKVAHMHVEPVRLFSKCQAFSSTVMEEPSGAMCRYYSEKRWGSSARETARNPPSPPPPAPPSPQSSPCQMFFNPLSLTSSVNEEGGEGRGEEGEVFRQGNWWRQPGQAVSGTIKAGASRR